MLFTPLSLIWEITGTKSESPIIRIKVSFWLARVYSIFNISATMPVSTFFSLFTIFLSRLWTSNPAWRIASHKLSFWGGLDPNKIAEAISSTLDSVTSKSSLPKSIAQLLSWISLSCASIILDANSLLTAEWNFPSIQTFELSTKIKITHNPPPEKYKMIILWSAPDRTRTCTLSKQYLKLPCLPIPPQAHIFNYSTVVPLPKSIASANSATPASIIFVFNYTTRSPDCQAGERAKHQPFCAW